MRIERGLAVAETRGERGKLDCQEYPFYKSMGVLVN